ncbi:MAG: hypothetical protein WBE34_20885 [Candidatus Nitrosopolaris sp.]
MAKRIIVYLQKMRRVRFVSCSSTSTVFLSVSSIFFCTLAISTIYAAELQQAIAQTTIATPTQHTKIILP